MAESLGAGIKSSTRGSRISLIALLVLSLFTKVDRGIIFASFEPSNSTPVTAFWIILIKVTVTWKEEEISLRRKKYRRMIVEVHTRFLLFCIAIMYFSGERSPGKKPLKKNRLPIPENAIPGSCLSILQKMYRRRVLRELGHSQMLCRTNSKS